MIHWIQMVTWSPGHWRGSWSTQHVATWHVASDVRVLGEGGLLVTLIDHFLRDITHIWKFDYDSTGHTWGGRRASNVLCSMGKTWPGHTFLWIVTCERPVPFVEQREHFQLPFLLQPCVTFPQHGTACWKSPFLFRMHNTCLFWWVDHCRRDSCQSWQDNEAQSDEPRLWW